MRSTGFLTAKQVSFTSSQDDAPVGMVADWLKFELADKQLVFLRVTLDRQSVRRSGRLGVGLKGQV